MTPCGPLTGWAASAAHPIYQPCDTVLDTSPAAYVRRPSVVAESPTLALSHLQRKHGSRSQNSAYLADALSIYDYHDLTPLTRRWRRSSYLCMTDDAYSTP